MRMKTTEELEQLVIRAGLDKLHGAIDEAKNELERVKIDLDFQVAIRTPKEKLAGHRRHIDRLREEIELHKAAVKEGENMLNTYVGAPLQPILPFTWERHRKGEFDE